MQRLRSSGSKIFPSLVVPQLKRKVSNSLSAVQDTYFSTKDIFERHRVVFTVATSIASVATAWAGYSMRHYHQSKMEERLESIEKSIKSNHHIEHDEIKKIVNSGTVSIPACIATAGTSLIIGYGLGWRGGKWYANRKFKREQMKLLGQIRPRKWGLKFLRRPLARFKTQDRSHNGTEASQGSTTSLPRKPAGLVDS